MTTRATDDPMPRDPRFDAAWRAASSEEPPSTKNQDGYVINADGSFTYTPAANAAVSGIQQDFRGQNIFRPNVAGDVYAPKDQRTINNWFNKDNVIVPTDISQPFGNAPRNIARGPLFWQVDFAMSKHFAFATSRDVEFRFEAFNLFNRTNFRPPNSNRSSAGFGTITTTYDPRQLQLGVKLNF